MYKDYTNLRMLFLVGVICVVFSMLVMNAYKFLPESDEYTADNGANTAVTFPSGSTINVKTNNDDKIQKNNMAGVDSNEDILNALNSSKNSGSQRGNYSAGDNYTQMYKKARELRLNSDYDNSILIAKKALRNAQNDSDIADCYELIAMDYAALNFYNPALKYAQKAYEISRSNSAELLIAKLYYKNGDVDKSKEILNSILKREFSDDK